MTATSFYMHLDVRGALNNGCTVEEIREALLHCAVYAGVPAAIDAFRAAQEVIDSYQQTPV